jgi:hypothetical protein
MKFDKESYWKNRNEGNQGVPPAELAEPWAKDEDGNERIAKVSLRVTRGGMVPLNRKNRRADEHSNQLKGDHTRKKTLRGKAPLHNQPYTKEDRNPYEILLGGSLTNHQRHTIRNEERARVRELLRMQKQQAKQEPTS